LLFGNFPGLAHDAEAGTLPNDPRDWFRQRLEYELQNTGPLGASKRRVLERAAQLVATARVGPPGIAAMLSLAGAPEPANSTGISQLAARCLTVAMGHQRSVAIDAQWEPYKQIFAEARAAHSKLRKLMPLLIALWKRSGNVLRAHEYEMLERELATTSFRGPSFSIGIGRAVWEPGARELADAYCEIVNSKAGWSRNGPAVRFLVDALHRAYPGSYPTEAAVEMLLAPRGPSSPIRDTQMILDKMCT
jgi:hypothetical protein